MNRALPSRRVALGAVTAGVVVAIAAAFAVTSGGGDAGATRPAGPSRVSLPPRASTARPVQARWSVASTGGEPMGVTADADGVVVCARDGEKGHDPCPTKLLWTRVQGSIVRTLDEMTLADLVRPTTRQKTETLTA